jgi:hypothetical protein
MISLIVKKSVSLDGYVARRELRLEGRGRLSRRRRVGPRHHEQRRRAPARDLNAAGAVTGS